MAPSRRGVAQTIASDCAGGNAPITTGQDGDIANLRLDLGGQPPGNAPVSPSDEVRSVLGMSSKAVFQNR